MADGDRSELSRTIVIVGPFERAPERVLRIAYVKHFIPIRAPQSTGPIGNSTLYHGIVDPDLVVLSRLCHPSARQLASAYMARCADENGECHVVRHALRWHEVAHALRRTLGAAWIYKAVFKLDPPKHKERRKRA